MRVVDAPADERVGAIDHVDHVARLQVLRVGAFDSATKHQRIAGLEQAGLAAHEGDAAGNIEG